MSDDMINTKLPTFEVHSAMAERKLREIANMLKKAMPLDFGFTLFIYDHGTDEDPGNLFYCSSSERADMVKVLKEFIAKQEAKQ